MYDFFSSPFCIYMGLMRMFIVINTCHVKCRGLSICNGVLLLKKERILHPRGICCRDTGNLGRYGYNFFGFLAIPS
jgi:hypothetical protein